MDMTSVYAPITKSYEQDDGSVIVEGIITDSKLDFDQQRCDPDWLKKAVPTWMAFGNLREQHDKHRAVGKAIEHRDLGDDGHFIRGRVVDTEAVKKVKAGIFNGFSIGVMDYRLSKSADTPNGVICGGRICEVSLVDYPCNENCRLTMVKSAKPGMTLKSGDFDSERMLVRVEELKIDEPELQKVSDMTVTLGDILSPEQRKKLSERVSEETPSPSNVGEDIAKGVAGGTPVSFDRDGAIDLVTKTVADADSGLGQDESGDISGALQAISIIAELIQSEAKDLGDTPAQGCDIDLLMQAVHALRIFNCREAKEQAGIDPGPGPIMLGADADVTKDSKAPYGDVSYADPGFQSDKKKRYPLDTKAHAKSAWDYINKSENADKYSAEQLKSIKSRIKSACKKFGVEVDADSQKAADVDNINTVDEAQKAADAALVVAESAPEEVEVVKAVDASEDVAPDEIEKTTEPETTEVAVEDHGDVLVKALSAALEKADSPLRKHFESIVEAATQSTAKSVTELAERLEKVEQMGVPGGPAQRRTEVERTQARKGDLTSEVVRFKSLAANAEDQVLRKGYTQKAAQLEAELKAL